MDNRPDQPFLPPQPGDGTLPSKQPHRPANWFGPSLEPQEEFLDEQLPNRRDAQPPPPPPETPPPATRDDYDLGEPV